NGRSGAAIVGLAASIEQRSTHPIAQAIIDHAAASNIPAIAAEHVASHPGRGAEGSVDGHHVLIGNHRLFEDRNLCSPAIHGPLDEMSVNGRTAVIVARDGLPLGVIAVADRPRESGRDAVDLLRRQGIESIVMLTGDSVGTARAIASELGLMADELLRIPYTFRLSRATVRNIKMNLAISIVMKAAFVVAAVAGVATLWMAILADTGASVIVIANALRLLRADSQFSCSCSSPSFVLMTLRG